MSILVNHGGNPTFAHVRIIKGMIKNGHANFGGQSRFDYITFGKNRHGNHNRGVLHSLSPDLRYRISAREDARNEIGGQIGNDGTWFGICKLFYYSTV